MKINRQAVRGVLRSVTSLACLALALALVPFGTVRAATTCMLNAANPNIRHAIYIQFDNTHFLRDNAGVPSDLEQMPHLLSFIRSNGTLFTNDHTVLISHTAGGILSTLTGVYPDRHGQTVSNSYVRTSSTGGFSFPSSFGYWTDSVSAANTPSVPNMITPDGTNAPAPWPVYTRAGCDVGAIATANVVLENTGTGPTGDITKVFGPSSPQFAEAVASASAPAGSAARMLAQTDFVGLAIHCALNSSTCASGQSDLLPAEPLPYVGFKGLFGAQAINPVVAGAPLLNDLLGQPIADPFGQPGFPGFDGMSAAVSLAYVAAMQEKGIAVTYAYISDAHDFHGVAGNAHLAFGPGSEGYVQQLKAYDDAFAAFFTRLAAHGITRENTLFIFTVDEGDHFVGVQKTGCDGITTPCVYGDGEVGEINANIDTLVTHQFPDLVTQFLGSAAPNAFTVHGDDAPPFYLAAKGSGPLAQTDALTRQFERAIGHLTAVNPYTGETDSLLVRMADQAGMRALHMFTTGDPARNATFVLFADADYFITDFPASTCETCINPAFAWNHGDIQPEIARTWIGLVGPGVQPLGRTDLWTDHTDVRPTTLMLLGLKDPYVHDGRAIVETLTSQVLPQSLRSHRFSALVLGEVYKQLNAPFGVFARDLLAASTNALLSGTPTNDATYQRLESGITALTNARDALATKIKAFLDASSFADARFDEREAARLSEQSVELLLRASALAHHS